MSTAISPKIVALTFGVLILSFLAVFYVVAWQEPTQAPPDGNVAAPLNTSATGQSKSGGLILNTGGAENGLIIDKGKICIGADCRSAWPATGVTNTYKMSVSSYSVGGKYFSSKTTSYTCPAGTKVILTYCKSLPNSCASVVYGNYCSCLVSDTTATLTAYVSRSIYYSSCVSPCCPSQTVESICMPDGDHTCYANQSCQMEFQCGKQEEVGTATSEECSYTIPLSGAVCNSAEVDSYCSTQCTSIGWRSGQSINCVPNKLYNVGYNNRACGLNFYHRYDNGGGGTSPYHDVSCRCWN